jgi:hypothetical protein
MITALAFPEIFMIFVHQLVPPGQRVIAKKIKAMRKQNSITLRSNPRARASSPQQFGESTTATRLEEITD